MTKLHGTNMARMERHIDAAKLDSLRARYRAGRPMRFLVRPLLLAVMLTALLVGLLSVVVEVGGDSRWFGLTFLLFFIALEAIYTTNWLNHPRQRPLDRTAYRAAEVLLLIIIVRIATWIIFGEGIPDSFEINSDELMQYLRNPGSIFLNTPFIISVVLAIIMWRLAISLGQIFSQLQVSEFELRFHSMPPAQRKARAEDQPILTGRKSLVDAFARFWLLGGVLLAAAVGISTLDQQSAETLMAPLASGRANLEPRLLGALLLYFVIGLWLLSQARLMQVHAGWLRNNVTADGDARQKWQRTSFLILVLVIVVAAFLPIGSTSTLSQIVGVILYWGLFVANILIFLVVLPFAMILALLSGRNVEDVAPLPPQPQPVMPPALESGPSEFAETLAIILSSGFWALAIVIVAMALLFYFRERRQGSSELRTNPRLWDQILAWLRTAWARLWGQVQSLQDSLILLREPDEETDQVAGRPSRWRFLRVSGLSPRDQIRYYYLSTVRRAGDRGIKRPSAGTPSEYAQDLKENWPEAEEELDELTEAFLKARYSNKPIIEDDIPPVKNTWKEVRRELRQGPEQSHSEEDGQQEES